MTEISDRDKLDAIYYYIKKRKKEQKKEKWLMRGMFFGMALIMLVVLAVTL